MSVDITVVAPSSYVGQFVCQSLIEIAPDLKVALAGRSAERIAESIKTLPSGTSQWEQWTLDVTDAAQCAKVAEDSRVIVNLAGPYTDLAERLVDACATAGTDYLDLTGELTFMQRSVDVNHRRSQVTGARIVHAAGFDSVPSDLTAWLAVQAAEAAGETVTEVYGCVHDLIVQPSGGTISSLTNEGERMARDPEIANLYRTPDVLTGGIPVGDCSLSSVPRRNADGTWVAEYLLGAANAAVVRRSMALSHASADQTPPAYNESYSYGRDRASMIQAIGQTIYSKSVMWAVQSAPARALLRKFLPAPGEGPSAEELAKGHFGWDTLAYCASGNRYRCHMGALGDPGYVGTGIILASAAKVLATTQGRPGGVLPPAAAIGEELADELSKNGFDILVRKEVLAQ